MSNNFCENSRFTNNLFDAWIDYQSAYLDMFKSSITENTKHNIVPDAFHKAWQNFYEDGNIVHQSFFELCDNYIDLYKNIFERANNAKHEERFSYNTGDKDGRFKNEAWNSNIFFNLLKQNYFLQAEWLRKVTQSIPKLDPLERKTIEFYTNQYIEAICPANFLFSNPVALETMINTDGQSLVDGAKQLRDDIRQRKISRVDTGAFEVGLNIAATPGKVVFQNELFQLIQYEPLTLEVHKKPILICAAWINKYYILDLQAEHSFVRWIIEQGFTVFVISWVNPGSELKDKTYEHYLLDGILTAIKQVKLLTTEDSIHCIGYCLGGTLLATALAYLRAQNNRCITSATFITTLTDFEECGNIGIFITEDQIQEIEQTMEKEGVFDGNKMADTFSFLRSRDMIWSFWINNYLLGKKPAAFDVLYWNADSTNLPARMHSYYLRNMYLHNNLIKGKISINNIKIDIKNIDIPTYNVATSEDHIAPWKSVFKGISNFKGKRKFILTASGHVVGVTNHPSRNKYSYWVNDTKELDADIWFKNSLEHQGSWWINWKEWAKNECGSMIPARIIKAGLEDAPGSYVRKRI